MPLIFAKILRKKKTVFEVRDLWPSGGIELGLINSGWPSKLAYWFEKLCYSKSDQLITASPGQRDHILKRYPTKEITVIPNASDIELFGKVSNDTLPDWTNGKKLFTHIGSLGLIHNTTFWLKVAKELIEIASIFSCFDSTTCLVKTSSISLLTTSLSYQP